MSEQHEKEMEDIVSQNGGLKTEIEKHVKERSENESYIRKFDEDVRCLMIKARNTSKNMESMLQQASQTRSDLEAELQRATIELQNVRLCNQEKDCQLMETTGKCNQLTEDLSSVYLMMQNSKNICLERSKRITELENEVKQLTDKIDQLQEDSHKKGMEYEAERRLRQKELLQLTEKINSLVPAFDALVSKKEELFRDFEKEKERLHVELSQNKSKCKHAEIKENELLATIKENEKVAHENERLIGALRRSEIDKLNEIGSLKSELNKRESSNKDLEEAHKVLNSSLVQAEKLHRETEEKLTLLTKCAETQNKEISDLKSVTTRLQDENEELTTKLRNAEFEQSRLVARNQDMGRYIELKNDQIVQLEERLQESEQQVRVLENAASRAGDEMRTSSASLAQRDAELAQLRDALAVSQAAHTAATRRCEEIRAELLGAVEQQQQESDRTLRQKEKQIGVLQESLNSLQKESDKSSKRIEKKMTDNLAYVEKLKDQLKESTQEKVRYVNLSNDRLVPQKEMAKQLTTSKQKSSKLEKEINEKKTQISTMEEQIGGLNEKIRKLNSDQDKLTALLSTKDVEIGRLRRVEAEFADFKRSVMENTPPCSTQISGAPEMEVQMTPQSPFRLEKFNQMVLLKTPQKTPKSILKQPGSECKRRRVLLISPERTSEIEDTPEEQKTELFHVDSMETVDLDATPDRGGTSKLHLATRTPNSRGTPQIRVPNVRKTPSTGNANRGPPTNTRTSTRQTRSSRNHAITLSASTVAAVASEASWFESDETFGLGAEE
nr:conserved hypothetical protein [Hymenolepis microstoma]